MAYILVFEQSNSVLLIFVKNIIEENFHLLQSDLIVINYY